MTETTPSREECIEILKKSGCNKNVIAHCLTVEGLAVQIAALAKADKNLVSLGALLHDIGRGKTHGIKHAVKGAEMVRELGLSDKIALIIERHIGAGLTREEAEKLGLPNRNYMPETLEEKIVAHADNLIDDNKKGPVSEVVEHFEKLGYKEVAKKVIVLHNELSHICGIDLDLI
ncbi:MAG: HDIG domain-containing protein [Methanomassiliicoccales archaeon]|nr:MAG: HDIG domain-containing protein [Methanomassiliicoccales archaeon]